MTQAERARRRVVSLILTTGIVLVCAGLYLTARYNPFMLDDLVAVVNNPDVTEPTRYQEQAVGDFWAGQKPWDVRYQPATVLSFRLNALATGLVPGGFRAINVALLALLGILVAAWINGYSRHPTGPWLAAALFVAHPTHALLINQIVGRAQILAMIGILGFLMVQRSAFPAAPKTQDPATTNGRPPALPPAARPLRTVAATLAAVFFAALALFSDRSGFLIFPMAAATAWVMPRPSRRWQPAPKAPRPTRRHPRWAAHLAAAACLAVPLWLYTQAYTVALDNAQFAQRVDPQEEYVDLTLNPVTQDTPVSQRLACSASLAWFYTKQLVWPDTRYDLTRPDLPRWTSGSILLGLAVIVALVFSGGSLLRRRRWLLLPVVLALGQHFLIGHWLGPGPVYASNLYMPPFTLAAVAWFAAYVDRTTLGSPRRRALAVAPVAICITVMASTVVQTNFRWLSPLRLALIETPTAPPDARNLYLRGKALMDVGRFRDADYWLSQAVDLAPDSLQARQSLAMALELGFEPQRAAAQYQRILTQKPENFQAHLRLAALSLAEDEFVTARHHIDAARRVHPFNAEVMYRLAQLERLEGNTAEAQRRYEQLLTRHPDHAVGRNEYNDLIPPAEAPPNP